MGVNPQQWKCLDEINAGNMDSKTFEEFENQYPKQFQNRKDQKLNYRYPRGESYLDLINRIEPIIFEIERSKVPIILVSHQAVIRCVYGFFAKKLIDEIPHLKIPLHTILKLTPQTYFCSVDKIHFDLKKKSWGLMTTHDRNVNSFI